MYVNFIRLIYFLLIYSITSLLINHICQAAAMLQHLQKCLYHTRVPWNLRE